MCAHALSATWGSGENMATENGAVTDASFETLAPELTAKVATYIAHSGADRPPHPDEIALGAVSTTARAIFADKHPEVAERRRLKVLSLDAFAAQAHGGTLTFHSLLEAIAASDTLINGRPIDKDVVVACQQVVQAEIASRPSLRDKMFAFLELLEALLPSERAGFPVDKRDPEYDSRQARPGGGGPAECNTPHVTFTRYEAPSTKEEGYQCKFICRLYNRKTPGHAQTVGMLEFTHLPAVFAEICSEVFWHTVKEVIRAILKDGGGAKVDVHVAPITEYGEEYQVGFLQEWAATAIETSNLFSCEMATGVPDRFHLHTAFVDLA